VWNYVPGGGRKPGNAGRKRKKLAKLLITIGLIIFRKRS
jgi:hypothetical protein